MHKAALATAISILLVVATPIGAALATLAADHYCGTRGVCTLGSPRVGDSVFARQFDSKLTIILID